MDFGLSEEHQAIAELATQILAEQSTPERLSELDAGDSWLDVRLWEELARSGLLGAALPEELGGGGQDFLAVHLLCEQVGATAAHVPVWPTLVLGALPLARFGTTAHHHLVSGVASGSVHLTAALVEDGRDDPLTPTTTARRVDGAWQIDGVKGQVPIAALADALLVSARGPDGVVVAVIEQGADGLRIMDQEVTAGWPSAQVELDGVRVGEAALLGGADGGEEVLRWLLARATSALASTQAGVCATALRLSATYTSQREQFGRPVATFQAVGQRVGDAFIDTEAVRLTSLQAAWLLAGERPATDEIEIAKWWAAESGHRVLHAAHHVHGGVGIDMDYELHRYFGLAKQIEFFLGSATTQLLAIGRSLAVDPS